ncbi:hypothetical protein [Methylophilus aquaticus]|uniref:Uncharacterized protein n=1 Tax=Methylophilus aquaticus TaxID=1971610 RepID=A0ABT9JWA3_9PROT|nr:hypothetical protein [Methylophilus aquaticus]MDP8568873.1 hypothetical protein [Methylophilus aquaticus]
MQPLTSSEHEHRMLLTGAALWLLMALLLAWCMVGLNFGVPVLKSVFAGKFTRLLQAHIDFLLMTALILGIAASRVRLPWHVRWAMVIGAFTNSSLFLLMAVFPALDNPQLPPPMLFQCYLLASIVTTSYGFGKAAVFILRSFWQAPSSAGESR